MGCYNLEEHRYVESEATSIWMRSYTQSWSWCIEGQFSSKWMIAGEVLGKTVKITPATVTTTICSERVDNYVESKAI